MDCQDAVTFLVVGPQRTASSWLDRALRTHPKLSLPVNVKETYYFDKYYYRGYNWYIKLFSDVNLESIRGEVGSTYFDSTEAISRLREHNENARIIIMVRNPILRAISSFKHEYAKGRVNVDFMGGVDQEPRILNAGHYSIHAPAWEAAFGKGSVLYVVQEDIESDPQKQLDKVFSFIGVEPLVLADELKARYGKATVPRFPRLASVASRTATALRGAGFHRVVETGKSLGIKRVYGGGSSDSLSISPSVLEYLLQEYEDDIVFLESRLERNLKHWRDITNIRL